MDNIKHTPGPWETSAGPWDDYTEGAAWEIIDGADTVASIADRPEAEANARLIAEAPAMLEALREFLCDQETMREPYRNEAICERARAILARIDGAPTAQPAGAIGEAGAGEG